MKHVLIPTDFSETAENAILYAVNYFANISVNFFLLHVSLKDKISETETLDLNIINKNQLVTDSFKDKLNKQRVVCETLTKNRYHQFFTLHENLSLVDALRLHIKLKEIDYIFLGTKGHSLKRDFALSSNTLEVITKVKCPVIVIPKTAHFSGIHTIAFPTDYNCIYKDKVINVLFETLKIQNANLSILHIGNVSKGLNFQQSQNKDYLEDFLKDMPHTTYLINNDTIELDSKEFVDHFSVEMVAVVAKNLNIIERILFKPVLISQEIPFLVIHE